MFRSFGIFFVVRQLISPLKRERKVTAHFEKMYHFGWDDVK
jgi:hypothetical protein